MYTPGVAEFSGSDTGCLPVSLSTMLTDTSGYSSSEVVLPLLKRNCLADLKELELDICSNTDLAFAGDKHVLLRRADALICLLRQCGVTWLAPSSLFS